MWLAANTTQSVPASHWPDDIQNLLECKSKDEWSLDHLKGVGHNERWKRVWILNNAINLLRSLKGRWPLEECLRSEAADISVSCVENPSALRTCLQVVDCYMMWQTSHGTWVIIICWKVFTALFFLPQIMFIYDKLNTAHHKTVLKGTYWDF